MRKLFYAFSVFAVLFASCSSDNDSSSVESAVLLKKVIATDGSGTQLPIIIMTEIKFLTVHDQTAPNRCIIIRVI